MAATLKLGRRSIRITASLKDFWMDDYKLRKAIGDANEGVLKKAGRNIRANARTMIGRKAKMKSKPRPGGKAVKWREKDPQGKIKWIRYEYDKRQHVEVIGFELLRGSKKPYVPATHEHGKTRKIITIRNKGRKLKGKAKRAFLKKFGRQGVPRKTKRITIWVTKRYPERPTMVLALVKSFPKITQWWKGALDRWASRGRGRPRKK